MFKKALALDPKSYDAELNLGILDFEEKDYSGTLDHLSHALELSPYDPTVHVWLKKYSQSLKQQ